MGKIRADPRQKPASEDTAVAPLSPPLPTAPRTLRQLGLAAVPQVFVAPGDEAAKRFLEFFTANIRNAQTREAYYRAVSYFGAWCDHRGLALADIGSVHVAAYVETLGRSVHQKTGRPYSTASVTQHLAAIRMLFDWLVVGQVVPFNPPSAVRGPSTPRRPTTHPEADEVRLLLDGIDTTTISGLRDRALIVQRILPSSQTSSRRCRSNTYSARSNFAFHLRPFAQWL